MKYKLFFFIVANGIEHVKDTGKCT